MPTKLRAGLTYVSVSVDRFECRKFGKPELVLLFGTNRSTEVMPKFSPTQQRSFSRRSG
jgi:hypothetical protein